MADLYDYPTGKYVRRATLDELNLSEASRKQGTLGVILVDGSRFVYAVRDEEERK